MRKILPWVVPAELAEGRRITLILQRNGAWRIRPFAYAPAGPVESGSGAEETIMGERGGGGRGGSSPLDLRGGAGQPARLRQVGVFPPLFFMTDC